VPLGILGAVAAALILGHESDVYFQVALLTTVGLASKNAILIVEFAKEQHAAGKSIVDASLEAARLRLRPILMTSMAFVLGVLPMALGSGAGSGAQNALGSAVIGGMLSATVLAIFFVPLFYVLVVSWTERIGRKKTDQPEGPKPGAAPPGAPAAPARGDAPPGPPLLAAPRKPAPGGA
jgi:multidrug efflux pump subunit AcrB